MTKKEIVKTISEEIGMTQLVTKEIVQKTFDAIIDTLVAEGRIELRNFGVFEVKKRKSRKARNPKTGDPVEVSEKFVVTFKPGKDMEEKVRRHGSVSSPEAESSPENPPAAVYSSPDADSSSDSHRENRPASASPGLVSDSPPSRDGASHRDGTIAAEVNAERRPESAFYGSRSPS